MFTNLTLHYGWWLLALVLVGAEQLMPRAHKALPFKGVSRDFARHCRAPANGCTWMCRPGFRAQDARG